ncbi:MAG: RluA family pseudouridine synthase, partial [Alphaproteobacteria bacterium]
MKEFTVTEEQAGMRIDRYLRQIAGPMSQGIIEKALRGGQIRVDSQKVKSAYRVEARQIVAIAPYFLEQAKKKPKPDSSEAKKT